MAGVEEYGDSSFIVRNAEILSVTNKKFRKYLNLHAF
jgi:hypothetical protein